MKLKLVRETIVREYWRCQIKEHRHQYWEVAERCIAKHSKPKRKINQWTKDRFISLAESYVAGMTLNEAGKPHGITPVRVREILRNRSTWRRYGAAVPDSEDWYGLTTKAAVKLGLELIVDRPERLDVLKEYCVSIAG